MEGIYHGRTQLGVGEHDRIKKRLVEERQKDYQDHMRRKESERVMKQMGHGEPQPPSVSEAPTGSVADIGYETSLSISQQRKQLNDTRRAEYAAHLAAQSASSQTERQDGSHIYTQTPSAQQQDGCTNTLHMAPASDTEEQDDRRQKQRDYAEALREQIAEKKKTSQQSKIREKEQEKKNIDMARGNKSFIYGSNSQLNSSTDE